MKMDETLHLSHIKLPEGVELVALAHGVEGHDLPIVSIHKPRIIEEDVPVAAAEGETAAKAAEGDKKDDAAKDAKKD
jgi:large subunit ribosomal protein L25